VALTLLIISLIAYTVGPALYGMAGRARGSFAGLDGFVLVAVVGLALVHIIPHAVVAAGGGALAIALAGFIGPGMVEHRLERAARQTHTAALILALSGLAVHEFFDGVGLASAFYDPSTGISALAVAVVLHRLPIAITVWWLLYPLRGPWVAAAVLGALGAATVLGYASVDAVADLVEARWLGLLEALIAGSLLHVVVHRPSPLHTPDSGRRERLSAGIGALLGLAAVIALGFEHHVPLHGHEAIGFRDVFVALARVSAPPLLLALVLASAAQILLPGASVRWMRSGHPTTEAMRGVAFGLPLPITACDVVPLYPSLVSQAVPATAAIAFLVATPALTLDSVMISLPLLGVELTLARLLAALLVALLVGATLGLLVERWRPQPVPRLASPATRESRPPLRERARAGLRFGFGDLVDHDGPWIVLGIAAAALAEPAVHAAWFAALPWGADVVLAAVVGMPLYVPAAGAAPLMAVLIHKGLSPGAALAFLLTGPATGAATFGVLGRLHGPRVARAFGAMMAVISVGVGLLVNALLPHVKGIALYEEAGGGTTILEMVCLAGLVLVLAASVLRQGPRGFIGQILSPHGDGDHSHED